MPTKHKVMFNEFDKPSRCTREVLVEQILWLIRLRWIAVGGIMVAVLVGSYVFPYPLLPNATPIYVCAGILLLCNIFCFSVATKKTADAGPKDVVLAMAQVEADLVILTAGLLFSGGAANPFFLFYIFHIIIATIILPRNLSFDVGLTTILLFGLLAVIKAMTEGLMFVTHDGNVAICNPAAKLWKGGSTLQNGRPRTETYRGKEFSRCRN